MSELLLTNSLTRKKEEFVPISTDHVGLYTCGPTVYQLAHIGNLRTYTTADVLYRLLSYLSYSVRYVMNLTDVGHLTGDNVGDADTGVDRMEESAKKQGKTAWDIAKYYTDIFLKDMKFVGNKMPWMMPKATDHIKEQIALISDLEKKGFTYKTTDGIYFNTVFFESETGKKYGELSTLDQIKSGARVEENPEKKNLRDFALWKFSGVPGVRQMEWESPWGLGFPGWHIECSAMSMKYLGESFDIHVGGEDLRSTHHPNEIAQSEASTGKQFVKYWIHVTFMKVNGEKMSKSKGNAYTVQDLIEKGYDPLSLRYLFLTSHYKDSMNFTWEALNSAEASLRKLRGYVSGLRNPSVRRSLSDKKLSKADQFRDDFIKAVTDDLGTPRALAVVWEMLKSNIPSEDKYDLLISFDEVLGLHLSEIEDKALLVSDDVKALLDKREQHRKAGDYQKSDEVRKEIEKLGYSVEDTPEGVKIKSI